MLANSLAAYVALALPLVVPRAKRCIERIEQGSVSLIPAVMRLLAVKRPKGAVELLLAYAPFAEGDYTVDEIGNALTALATENGQVDPALKPALRDAQPVR